MPSLWSNQQFLASQRKGRPLERVINNMDYVISYDEIAALVANPPSLAPRPNFTNLRNLRRHIQRALMHVSCPQSNILGWAGLIMSRAMYGLLATTPFRLPLDPGPLAIYYPAKIPIVDAQGDPVQSWMQRGIQHTNHSQPSGGLNSQPSTRPSSAQKIIGSRI